MWRAGLPRAGWQSHPNRLTMLHQTPQGGRFWGLLRNPAGDEPPSHKKLAAPRNLLWTTVFMWRAGLPRAGWQSHPNRLTMLHQTPRGGRIWGCCATQRGTSPLATRNLPHPRTYCEPPSLCGERACPALGGEATPTASPCSTRHPKVAGSGACCATQRGAAP